MHRACSVCLSSEHATTPGDILPGPRQFCKSTLWGIGDRILVGRHFAIVCNRAYFSVFQACANCVFICQLEMWWVWAQPDPGQSVMDCCTIRCSICTEDVCVSVLVLLIHSLFKKGCVCAIRAVLRAVKGFFDSSSSFWKTMTRAMVLPSREVSWT